VIGGDADPVHLEGVSKRYAIGQPWVLRDVSLEIRPGTLARFEGRNGSGKSTLLRLIAGILTPTRGIVRGRTITGYVPERFPPALPFSGRDYLTHLGRLHGLAGRELAARIEDCLDRLGGAEIADVQLRHASKGTCQKVAVAQALLPGRGLLVLDEAWTGLDEPARTALDEIVAERVSDGGPVVFVDHDKSRLAGLTTQRWRIKGRRVEGR
jgi:ABC-2 type transport system ATP-binding protein